MVLIFLLRAGLVFTMDNIQDIRPEGGYSMLCIYLILLLHTIVYMIVYYYFVQVFPGPFGTPRPFYFPFQPSFYCRNKVASSDDIRSDNGSDVPLNGEIVVRVRGISKEFRPLFGKICDLLFSYSEWKFGISPMQVNQTWLLKICQWTYTRTR